MEDSRLPPPSSRDVPRFRLFAWQWVHGANLAVVSKPDLWTTAWQIVLAAAASVLESPREGHALDGFFAPTKECSLTPEGSAAADAVEHREEDGDVKQDEDVHHGAFDDVYDNDTTTDTAVEQVEPVSSGVGESAATEATDGNCRRKQESSKFVDHTLQACPLPQTCHQLVLPCRVLRLRGPCLHVVVLLERTDVQTLL